MSVYSYKWHEIDKFMTIPIYKELSSHQKKFPPYYQLICSYFGVGIMKEESNTQKISKTIDASLINTLKGTSFGEVKGPREV